MRRGNIFYFYFSTQASFHHHVFHPKKSINCNGREKTCGDINEFRRNRRTKKNIKRYTNFRNIYKDYFVKIRGSD